MSKQTQLFEKPKTPRLKRAHALNIGQGMAKFECDQCEWESDWIECNRTEIKRGAPCPVCNPILPSEWEFLKDDA